MLLVDCYRRQMKTILSYLILSYLIWSNLIWSDLFWSDLIWSYLMTSDSPNCRFCSSASLYFVLTVSKLKTQISFLLSNNYNLEFRWILLYKLQLLLTQNKQNRRLFIYICMNCCMHVSSFALPTPTLNTKCKPRFLSKNSPGFILPPWKSSCDLPY